ncbi:MAG: AAA family ATPase, partial [Bryobacteraceae bacterium]
MKEPSQGQVDPATGNSGARSGGLGPNGLGTRLESWKEIAVYLKRHVTTVRRWEKQEGLPAHRHVHSRLGSVYAYTKEIDSWFDGRQPEQSDVTASQLTVAAPLLQGYLPPPQTLIGPRSWRLGLLGRVGEMKLLGEAWTIASQGHQQLVLITGEPGQGKTRLAHEFAHSVERQATILLGGCDREALVPFAPFVSILQWLVRATPAETLQRHLKEIAGSNELAELEPEISKLMRPARETVSATAEGRRFRMFEAYRRLLELTSRHCPILLLVEDLHLADRGTYLLLRHLVRSTREAAICIVVTYRDNEIESGSWSQDLIEDLRRDTTATRIPVRGLPEDDVRSFAQSWLQHGAPRRLTEFLFKNTEGNPLFMTEMLTHLTETGGLERLNDSASLVAVADLGLPEGIRELIGRRVARLSPTSHKLLAFGAIIGHEFDLSLIEDLADLPEDAVLDGIEEAVAARIIDEVPGAPGRFCFTHMIVRETLYGSMTVPRRMRLHRRVGEAIERESQPDRLPLSELAYHF